MLGCRRETQEKILRYLVNSLSTRIWALSSIPSCRRHQIHHRHPEEKRVKNLARWENHHSIQEMKNQSMLVSLIRSRKQYRCLVIDRIAVPNRINHRPMASFTPFPQSSVASRIVKISPRRIVLYTYCIHLFNGVAFDLAPIDLDVSHRNTCLHRNETSSKYDGSHFSNLLDSVSAAIPDNRTKGDLSDDRLRLIDGDCHGIRRSFLDFLVFWHCWWRQFLFVLGKYYGHFKIVE